ncbi:unnamed protein product [Closterium sp. Naga37s-1]|nr:unnamed protein product [Closterium sp. Naga37s-1]
MGVVEEAVANTLQGASTQDGQNKGFQSLGVAIPADEVNEGVVLGSRSADKVQLPERESGAGDKRPADASVDVRHMQQPSVQAGETVPGSVDFGGELPHDFHNDGRDAGFGHGWEEETEERSRSPSDHRRRRRSKKDEIIELLLELGREVRDGRAEMKGKMQQIAADMQRSLEDVKTSTASSLQQLAQSVSGVAVDERVSSSVATAVKAATTHLHLCNTNAVPVFTEKQLEDVVAAVKKAAADALESAAQKGMWTLAVPTALHQSIEESVQRAISRDALSTDGAGLPPNPKHAVVEATFAPTPNLANQGAANVANVSPVAETEDARNFHEVYTVPVTQGDVVDRSRKGGDVNFARQVVDSYAVEQCNTLPVAAGERTGTASQSFDDLVGLPTTELEYAGQSWEIALCAGTAIAAGERFNGALEKPPYGVDTTLFLATLAGTLSSLWATCRGLGEREVMLEALGAATAAGGAPTFSKLAVAAAGAVLVAMGQQKEPLTFKRAVENVKASALSGVRLDHVAWPNVVELAADVAVRWCLCGHAVKWLRSRRCGAVDVVTEPRLRGEKNGRGEGGAVGGGADA